MESSNKIAISFLAYGDEHIKELNCIVKQLTDFYNKIEFFIATNDISKVEYHDVNLIEIKENFNYNLKRLSIDKALINHDVVLFLDTDTKTKTNNINFNFLNELEDGLYVNWVDTIDKIQYKGKITLDRFLNQEIKTFINLDYFNKLKKFTPPEKDVYFIRESFFVVILKNKNKKDAFIKNWNLLFNQMNFNTLSNNKTGIMEGLIIYLSCVISNINVFDISTIKSLYNFYNDFNHIGDNELKDIYNKKELI
jgi:hypothetical protein